MADYAKEMKALEGMITQEEANEMSQRDRYNDGAQIANMMTPISKPSQGSAEILLKSQPMDRSAEMEMAWTGGSKSRVDSSLLRQKRLMEKYKELQDAQAKGSLLDFNKAKFEQEQNNWQKQHQLDWAKLQAEKNKGGGSQTPLQKKIDEKFADKVVDWMDSRSDTQKSLIQLKAAANMLKNSKNISGPLSSLLSEAPIIGKRINPEASRVKSAIEEVVQRNLRKVLGAQFTEKEGERLIQRAYDPSQSQEENALRVNRLITQIELHEKYMDEMAEHIKRGGSAMNYDGIKPTEESFIKGMYGDEGLEYYMENGSMDGFKENTSYVSKNTTNQTQTKTNKVKVSNGRETYEIPREDLQDAIADGFQEV